MSRDRQTDLADIVTACEKVTRITNPELLRAIEAFKNENPVDP